MSTAKTLAAVQRTKQFKNLLDANLTLVSTDRQMQNGTLAFTGKLKVGRKTIRPVYAITAKGAVISNENTIRRITAETPIAAYRQGLAVIAEVLSKRLAV